MAIRYEPVDWYDEPLYYDIPFDGESQGEADFLEAMLTRHGSARSRSVLEPACGSGRLLAEMAARGYRVTGFDANAAMVRHARWRMRKCRRRSQVVQARMEQFAFSQRFGLAHCLVSTFRYLRSEAAARAHLRCVRDALAPGGLYVLGLLLSDYGATRCSRERHVGRRGGIQVVCNTQSWPAERQERRERFRTRLIVTERGRVRRTETRWWFRSYDAAELHHTLRAVPDLEHMSSYDFAGDRRPLDLHDDLLDCVVVLRKRSRR